jgi:hypothetical protein
MLNWALVPHAGSYFHENIAAVIDGVPFWDGYFFWWLFLPLFVYSCAALFLPKNLFKNSDLRAYCPDRVEAKLFAVTAIVLLLFSLHGTYFFVADTVFRVTGVSLLSSVEKYPYRWSVAAYFCAVYVISSASMPWAKVRRLNLVSVLILAVPLLYSCCIWVSIGTSVPFENYRAVKKKRLKSAISSVPEFLVSRAESVVTPYAAQISLLPAPQSGVVYLSGVSVSDMKYLELSSTSKTTENLQVEGTGVIVRSDGTRSISVRVKKSLYRPGLYVSAMAWIIGLTGLIISSPLNRKYRASPS